ncbi:unnamed protein product [Sphagnum jensenii]|uniref:DUF7811 domain-containing protein n=1 Tax=Sphagnum jensenii TaxID=128206 RepID=A0ABP0X4K8_9BRYO
MAAGCCLQLLICYPYETQSQLRTRVSASWNSSSSSFSTSRSIHSLIGKTGICSPRIRVGRSSSCGQRQQQQQHKQHKHGAIAGGGARREGKSRKMRVYAQAGRDSSSSSSSSNPNDAGGGEEGRLPWSSRDEFGLYPWDPSWGDLESMDSSYWYQEDTVTLFTTDGLVQIGGSLRRISPESKQARLRALSRQRRYREEDYMDPQQGLCLGAIFDIAATNGLDMGRRFCVCGFCRSIEMLNDVVQDTVLEQGGKVVVAEKGSTGGLQEKLSMTVAMPLLWGVPPAVDTLHYAIRSGGGIVERTYRCWEFL